MTIEILFFWLPATVVVFLIAYYMGRRHGAREVEERVDAMRSVEVEDRIKQARRLLNQRLRSEVAEALEAVGGHKSPTAYRMAVELIRKLEAR